MNPFERRKQQLGVTRRPTDVDRVLSLPRDVKPEVADLSAWLRPGQVNIDLRPVQQQALRTLAENGGLLGGIGVGHGKSFIALLAGMVAHADVSIVLVAPATVPIMQDLLKVCTERYFLPTTHILSWGALSQTDSGDLLEKLVAGHGRICVVADEAHCARNASAARTKRLMRFLNAHPDATFVAMSGTLTSRRLRDFAHLAHRALGASAPVPRGQELEAWDTVLANDYRSPADVASVKPLWQWAEVTKNKPFPKAGTVLPDEVVAYLADAFGERLQTCPGVVLTQDLSCGASLYINQMQTTGENPVFRKLWVMAEEIAKTYKDPEGTLLCDDAEIARTAKRLSLGYYYKWEWPSGSVNHEYLDIRQNWGRVCRKALQGNAAFDTEFGLAKFINTYPNGVPPEWLEAWTDWVAVRKGPNLPETVAYWISDEPLQTLVDLAQRESAILWYDEEAVADKLEALGMPVVRAGQVLHERSAVPLALSVRAHGTGLNLQAWSKNVFACVPGGGTQWEQVLGRTHRAGQQEDEVWAWVPAWSGPLRSGLKSARQDAGWIERSTGNRQRLNMATYIEV